MPMQTALQISFRHMDPSPAVESKIREKAGNLEKYCNHITACHVVIEAPHEHHHKGKLYRIGIDLTLPRGEVIVSRDHHDNHAHEDIYVSIRDAFKAAKRQLEDFVRRQRGDVKRHEQPFMEVATESSGSTGYE